MPQATQNSGKENAKTSIIRRKNIGPNVQVTCLGKRNGVNWSLSLYQGNTLTGKEATELFIRQQMHLVGLDFTGLIYSMRMAKDRVTMQPFHEDLFPDKYYLRGKTLSICKSAGANHFNAVTIPRGVTLAFPVADCLVAIFRDKKTGEVVAAHCGRDNLMHWEGKDWSKKEYPDSVVNSVLDYLIGTKGGRPQDIEVHTFCGIEAKYFSHPSNAPEYGKREVGKRNRRMLNYLKHRGWFRCLQGPEEQGYLSLHNLLSLQCRSRSVPSVTHTDEVCDASGNLHVPKGTYGDPHSWSHREWYDRNANGDTDFVDGRNLVLVSVR